MVAVASDNHADLRFGRGSFVHHIPPPTTLLATAVFFTRSPAAAPAAAQSPSQRPGRDLANVGVQTGASTFTASNTFASNGGESETITVDQGVKTTPGFSVGAAVRVGSRKSGWAPSTRWPR